MPFPFTNLLCLYQLAKKCIGLTDTHPWLVKFKTFAKEKDYDDLSRHINQLQIESSSPTQGKGEHFKLLWVHLESVL